MHFSSHPKHPLLREGKKTIDWHFHDLCGCGEIPFLRGAQSEREKDTTQLKRNEQLKSMRSLTLW